MKDFTKHLLLLCLFGMISMGARAAFSDVITINDVGASVSFSYNKAGWHWDSSKSKIVYEGHCGQYDHEFPITINCNACTIALTYDIDLHESYDRFGIEMDDKTIA